MHFVLVAVGAFAAGFVFGTMADRRKFRLDPNPSLGHTRFMLTRPATILDGWT